MAINRNGIETLKPAYLIIIIALTIVSTAVTCFLTVKKFNSKALNVFYQINDLLFMIVIAIIIIQICFSYIFFPAQVLQTSMYPTLEDKQMVVSSVNFEKERFNIVVIEVDQETADNGENMIKTGEKLVKRIIGLPGEYMYYENGLLYINGNHIEEPFLEEGMVTDDYIDYKNTPIPEGCYVLLGDHRQGSIIEGVFKPGSLDSRVFGAVKGTVIKGKVEYKRLGFFNWERVA